MTISDLKNTVEELELDYDSKCRMIRKLSRAAGKSHPTQKMLKIAAAAAVVLIAAGAVSVPVRAFVSSLVRERMDQVPEETIHTTLIQLDNQDAEADSFSRDYTDSEKERMTRLWEEYRHGLFPSGSLLQVADTTEAAGTDLYFITTDAKFYLPADRELTDEEILQIIDFNEMRKYALQDRVEQETTEAMAQNIAEGGITPEQAIELSKEYLQSVYHLDDIEHMTCVFGAVYNEKETGYDDFAIYNVHWEDADGVGYGFSINAEDGTLVNTFNY